MENEKIYLVSKDEVIDSKSTNNYKESCFATFLRALGCCFGFACIPCCYPFKNVNEGSQAVVQRFGKLDRVLKPGFHYVNPLTEDFTSLSMKIQTIDLEKQNVITSDKFSINIDGIVTYQVTNISDALFQIENFEHSIIELAHTTLRNVIGNSTLETCLSKRDRLAVSIKEIVDETVHNWGIKIDSIQIKDIRVPENTAIALSSAVIAERVAQGKIITAEADVKAAKLMRETADILSTPAALQMKCFEIINNMSQNPNTKVMIIPTDLNLHTNMLPNLVTKEALDL